MAGHPRVGAARRRRGPVGAVSRVLPPDDPRHGTPTGYSYWGCRCDTCRDADSVARRTRRAAAAAPPQDPAPRRQLPPLTDLEGALCARAVEPEWWDTDIYGPGTPESLAAQAACEECPALAACAAAAPHDPNGWGIWAGQTPDQRFSMHRGQRRARAALARVEAAHARGQDVLDVCRASHVSLQTMTAVARGMGASPSLVRALKNAKYRAEKKEAS